MDKITGFLIKKKVNDIFKEEDKTQYTMGESFSIAGDWISEKFVNCKEWISDKIPTKEECAAPVCNFKVVDGSRFCQYHKCPKCNEKRDRRYGFCQKHKIY